MSEPQNEPRIVMPRYECHKAVYALKISAVEEIDDTTFLCFVDTVYGPFEVSKEYMEKHQPQVGGYYVVCSDGCRSFSPAKTFEDGYKLID